ncbi:MAG TPA: FtsX-like permease family protein [Chloroflexia bacterium]|nr:FtsX-like permease family protein [Chloroflexia bacterium]
MFLALREIKHSRLRFTLIGAIMALIAWLVFLLTGLATGLATDNGSSIINMPADYLVFQSDSRFLLHRSLLPSQTVEQVKQIQGVKEVAPLGHLTVTTSKVGSSQQIDATILAIDANSFLAPRLTEGSRPLSSTDNKIIVDEHFKRQGLQIGDSLQIKPSGPVFTISGFTKGQTYSHLPVMFTSIQQWQAIKFAAPGSSGDISSPISAVAVKMDSSTAAQVAKIPGVEVASRQVVLENLSGYKEEMGTINMIQVFLLLIAAFIMAAFFYVLTLQKTNQFGVLKVLGASVRFLARELIAQVLILTIVGVVAGAALTYGVAAIIPANVPFALDSSLVLIYGVILLVVALLGTLLSLRKIAKIDPLIAIGRVD